MKKFDPRSKLMFVIAVSSLGVFIKDLYLLSAVTFLSLAAAQITGGNIIRGIRKLKTLYAMIIVIAVLQSVFNNEGRVLFELFEIPLMTTAGLEKGIEFILRMTIIIISATIITTSTSREMIQGLVQLKIPYETAFLVSLGIRFLPMLTEEIKDSFTALKLRGVVFKNISLKKKIRIITYLFLPVIAGTIKKAEKIALSMETKGFRAKKHRTSYMVLKYSVTDYYLIAFSVLILLTFTYMNHKLK